MVHEHDHECGCGHHHHDEDTEHLHTNKYQQAFAKFEAAGTTEEVTGRAGSPPSVWRARMVSLRPD